MSASAVQFRGIKPVIEAYEMNDVPNWALFCGKNIFGQYTDGDINEGGALLNEWLTKLQQGGSGALYQLRMYKNNKGDITNTTEFNFSFTFRLLENELDQPYNAFSSHSNYAKEIAAMREEIRQLKEERDSEPEEIGGIQGLIGNLLQNEDVRTQLMHLAGAAIGKIFGIGQPPAAVAGVPHAAEGPVDMAAVYNSLAPEQKAALDEGLQILLTGDPDAGMTIRKIAYIMRDQPQQYAMYKSFLK